MRCELPEQEGDPEVGEQIPGSLSAFEPRREDKYDVLTRRRDRLGDDIIGRLAVNKSPKAESRKKNQTSTNPSHFFANSYHNALTQAAQIR